MAISLLMLGLGAVDPDFALAFFNPEELVAVIMDLFPDLLAGLRAISTSCICFAV